MGKITINGKDLTKPFKINGKEVKEIMINGKKLSFEKFSKGISILTKDGVKTFDENQNKWVLNWKMQYANDDSSDLQAGISPNGKYVFIWETWESGWLIKTNHLVVSLYNVVENKMIWRTGNIYDDIHGSSLVDGNPMVNNDGIVSKMTTEAHANNNDRTCTIDGSGVHTISVDGLVYTESNNGQYAIKGASGQNAVGLFINGSVYNYWPTESRNNVPILLSDNGLLADTGRFSNQNYATVFDKDFNIKYSKNDKLLFYFNGYRFAEGQGLFKDDKLLSSETDSIDSIIAESQCVGLIE